MGDTLRFGLLRERRQEAWRGLNRAMRRVQVSRVNLVGRRPVSARNAVVV